MGRVILKQQPGDGSEQLRVIMDNRLKGSVEEREFWHGYNGLVSVKREDTNIRPGYIGHQHLYDGLMSDVQICLGEGVHSKKIKVVEDVAVMKGVRRGLKGFGIYYLGHLMKLCPSGGLWVRKKTLILSGTRKRFNRHVVMAKKAAITLYGIVTSVSFKDAGRRDVRISTYPSRASRCLVTRLVTHSKASPTGYDPP
ncbi:hypothetical protein ACLOJK_019279 [Asimina triloba]